MGIETERKFVMEPASEVPDLSSVVSMGDSRTHDLKAVYFDTPDFLLARNQRILRRRTGGTDAGWHLKLPAGGDSREEIHAPLGRRSHTRRVPVELRRQVADVIGYAPLLPVVELVTIRHETDLTDGDGTVAALLCDDTVTAVRGGESRTWRELEVEVADDGDAGVLEKIGELFLDNGISPSPSTSKLVQALGTALTQTEESGSLGRKSSAAEVVGAYFADQVGVIQGREPEVRADEPDAVHKMRVATRRLRSALQTYRPLLDTSRTNELRAELKWLGEALGGPRDAEVLSERLIAEVAELPEDALVGPIVERIRTELTARHKAAHKRLVKALDSARYRTLSDALVDLLSDPPFTDAAAGRARSLLPERLEQVGRRTLKEWRQAEKQSGPVQMEGWHETRKRAKAARYACEAVVPALGDSAKKSAAAWEGVTEALGTVQDATVAREALKELADAATSHHESAFSYGVLYQRELDRSANFHAEAVAAIKNAKKVALNG